MARSSGGSVFTSGGAGGSVFTSGGAGGSVFTSGGAGGSVFTSGGAGGSVFTSGGVGGEGANGRASTGEAVSVARTGLACFGVLLLFLLFLLFLAFAVFLFGTVLTARVVFASGRAVFRFLAFVAFFLFGAVLTARVVFASGRAVFRFLFFAAAVLTGRVLLMPRRVVCLLMPRRVVFLFLGFASAVVLGVVRFRTFSLAVALARFFVDFRVRFAPDPSWARLFALLGGCDRRRLVACEVRRDDVFFFAIPGPL